jgi:drug/metabolite transporter (DMT)-like permease
MKPTIKIFGILLILAGVSLIFAPEFIFDFIGDHREEFWVYFVAIAVRLFLGAILILSAKQSKHPLANRIIGGMFVLAALIFLFIGQQNLQEFIAKVLYVFAPLASFVGLVSIAFGSFFIYSFSGRSVN